MANERGIREILEEERNINSAQQRINPGRTDSSGDEASDGIMWVSMLNIKHRKKALCYDVRLKEIRVMKYGTYSFFSGNAYTWLNMQPFPEKRRNILKSE